MTEPDPTDAELDLLEKVAGDRFRMGYSDASELRLIKALRACRVQPKAKDAVVEAARQGLGSMRAFLAYFNLNELREDKARQWLATNEMLDRVDDKLAALSKEEGDGAIRALKEKPDAE